MIIILYVEATYLPHLGVVIREEKELITVEAFTFQKR